MWRRILFLLIIVFLGTARALPQELTIARQWNEVLLEAIRNDFARPTVHARNLFHISAGMYDAWAVFDSRASTYFLGKTVNGIEIPFDGFDFDPIQKETLRKEAISYTAYHVLNQRFETSPGYSETKVLMDDLFLALGYDKDFSDTDYTTGSAAALGLYIAEQIKLFGWQDGSNERGDYQNLYYEPVNEPLDLFERAENPMVNPNRWQPLQFGNQPYYDQSGNLIEGGIIDFLSPEWGNVFPFSLTEDDKTEYVRDGDTYYVWHDPGSPPGIDSVNTTGIEDPYKWNFSLVSVWSSHLSPDDGVMWDISPRGIGNINLENLPTEFSEYNTFYDMMNGGDPSTGYDINPITSTSYQSQMVPRGDYARVLAEFWADGPDSETPPGHWFVILNYVMDQAAFEYRWQGQGALMDPLEYELKAYFTLGGAMHDAAIASWSIKGYYDYIRPISAIRYMATKGQSSDDQLPNYHPAGIPLIDGHIELIEEGDPLAGTNNVNVNKIKVMAWRGPDYVGFPGTDEAGVGWIMAKDWWPYQRPSFVTPPFAGYVSGHSTYSRTAAEVLTLMTGTEYFPGGMGEFFAPQDEFLVFEDGPSVDVTLQWATYYDASDQCSLSRIWGGIHPPADDLRGRKIGQDIGPEAFNFANEYFNTLVLSNESTQVHELEIYPNPSKQFINVTGITVENPEFQIIDLAGRVQPLIFVREANKGVYTLDVSKISKGIYMLRIQGEGSQAIFIQK